MPVRAANHKVKDRDKKDLQMSMRHCNTKHSAASGPREKNKDCYRGKRKGGIRMPYNSKTLGLIIGTERVKKGMTQEQLSGLAGISRSHLAALESGQKSPKVETIWKIAEALSIKPSKLIMLVEKSIERDDIHDNT